MSEEEKKVEEQKKSNTEDVYLESAKKLRSSLPKFVVYISTITLIWIFSTTLFIPMGTGIKLGDIEVNQIIDLIILITFLVLILASFNEIKNVADAIAGYISFYVSTDYHQIDKLRIMKWKKILRTLFYIILVSVFFLFFRGLLEQIHPAAPGIVIILIVIASVIVLFMLVMAMGAEIEEATKKFVDRFEKISKRAKKEEKQAEAKDKGSK
jgi:formate hydrogenlyase subunit 4